VAASRAGAAQSSDRDEARPPTLPVGWIVALELSIGATPIDHFAGKLNEWRVCILPHRSLGRRGCYPIDKTKAWAIGVAQRQ